MKPYFTLIIIVLLFGCRKNDLQEDITDYSRGTNIATRWADLTLDVIKTSYRNTPTYSSRSLGYMGLCMYECVVHSDSSKKSLYGQLNGLSNLPSREGGAEYNWKVALNSGQETLLKLLYPVNKNASENEHNKIVQLAEEILDKEKTTTSPATIDRSIGFGKQVALAIFDWCKNDGGFEGFKNNFDSSFSFPAGASFWVPPVKGQSPGKLPLHPYWGNNRSFLEQDHLLPIPKAEKYSTNKTSPYYKLYQEVYVRGLALTQEEMEIAAWWGDDPSETFSPPGHSYNLVTIAVKQSHASLIKSAEAYARVGLAVADAFIHCWKSKYKYFNERPSSYIKANINSEWLPFWPEPPFPAFPSGHAIQASASAVVLTDVFGNNFSFIDNSHQGRVSAGIKFRSRSFQNFWQFAEECAYSRLLGGIHTRQDNQAGLEEGKKIGTNINRLQWTK